MIAKFSMHLLRRLRRAQILHVIMSSDWLRLNVKRKNDGKRAVHAALSPVEASLGVSPPFHVGTLANNWPVSGAASALENWQSRPFAPSTNSLMITTSESNMTILSKWRIAPWIRLNLGTVTIVWHSAYTKAFDSIPPNLLRTNVRRARNTGLRTPEVSIIFFWRDNIHLRTFWLFLDFWSADALGTVNCLAYQ